MIKNYIDLTKINKRIKANVMYSFIRRSFSIDNIKYLFADLVQDMFINESDSPMHLIKDSNKNSVGPRTPHLWCGAGEVKPQTVNYYINILYTSDSKDEYRELIKDTFYYTQPDSANSLGTLAIFKNNIKGQDKILNTPSGEGDILNVKSSSFVIEHILYMLIKKINDRGIEIDSIKKLYIYIGL